VDIVTGGSPCQDLSVAGRRAGLRGERSGLFMEQIRIVKEMRREDERNGRAAHAVRPRYVVWENVPGAFSSGEPDGEDFRIVLEEICRVKDRSRTVPRPDSGSWEPAGGIVLGNEFSLAWRVLDAQFWGVPQRRKRIYLVADFGGLAAPEILFKQDGLFGNPAPGEGAGQEAAADAGSRAETAGGDGGVTTAGGGAVTSTLFAGYGTRPNGNAGDHFISRPIAFAANQRDEVRDLNDIAGALQAEPGMKQQTFVANCLTPWDTQQKRIFTPEGVAPAMAGADGGGGRNPAGPVLAGFSPKPSAKAGGVGYEENRSPTLTGNTPAVLCLNDQGGRRMDVSEDVSGTLRAQMDGHPPIVMGSRQENAKNCEDLRPADDDAGTGGDNRPMLFENHGIDSRYTGPHGTAPTMSARYGTGGNNVPLIGSEPDSYCIAGNTIDREVSNGGNGLGCQSDISYTLNTADRHAVFSRQRSDEYTENEVSCTRAARQHKDATDLICQPEIFGQSQYGNYAEGCTTLRAQGGDNGGGSENLVKENGRNLIRRLTPLECERLQGFPDGWTDIPGASDSARYKALGNSVAIPCVEFVMRGIAHFLKEPDEQEKGEPI
jgi:DNA (cytosine-5)-methyltransferase 1